MLREESLHMYYSRWKLNLEMYRTSLVDEAHEDPHDLDIQSSKRFLMSLDQTRFGELVNKYRDGDRDWPPQVNRAFQACEIHHNSNVRSQYVSSSMNRRGAFVANVAHANHNAPTTVKCERCGLTSHSTSVCPKCVKYKPLRTRWR